MKFLLVRGQRLHMGCVTEKNSRDSKDSSLVKKLAEPLQA